MLGVAPLWSAPRSVSWFGSRCLLRRPGGGTATHQSADLSGRRRESEESMDQHERPALRRLLRRPRTDPSPAESSQTQRSVQTPPFMRSRRGSLQSLRGCFFVCGRSLLKR